jgi:hypothetical protein
MRNCVALAVDYVYVLRKERRAIGVIARSQRQQEC